MCKDQSRLLGKVGDLRIFFYSEKHLADAINVFQTDGKYMS